MNAYFVWLKIDIIMCFCVVLSWHGYSCKKEFTSLKKHCVFQCLFINSGMCVEGDRRDLG